MELNEIEAVQREVKNLFENEDVIGISDDRIQFKVNRFLDEFDEFDWYIHDTPARSYEQEYHLYAYYNGLKFVAVFNDYDMDKLDKVHNEEFKIEIIEKF